MRANGARLPVSADCLKATRKRCLHCTEPLFLVLDARPAAGCAMGGSTMVIIHYLGAWCIALKDIAMQKFEEFAPNKCPRRPCPGRRHRWSAQTDVAITNGGGIRGGKGLSAGRDPDAVRRARRAAVRHRLVTLDVTGAVLTAAIENGLSKLPNPNCRFSQVRPHDRGRHQPPPGSRVTAI